MPRRRPAAAAPRVSTRRRLALRALAVVSLAALPVAVALVALERLGLPPRTVALQLEHRVPNELPVAGPAVRWLAGQLVRLERDPAALAELPILQRPNDRGASTDPAPGRRAVAVFDVPQLLAAIRDAAAGDVITLAPGRYRLQGKYVSLHRPGRADAPITLRAAEPGSAVLELETHEGLLVSAPYWRIENLTLQGVCRWHADCEHALHVVGKAHHLEVRNSSLIDFNAHVKINGDASGMPDHGVLADNTLLNREVRRTSTPVTPIDLVAASDWRIEGNRIADFVKGDGDRTSYGAFAKGGGARNRFSGNLVVCEWRLRGSPGTRVGLSLGGGGTGRPYCRDRRCITEQDDSTIENNLIASCSDDGIDLNRAATSRVAHNTLIDTAGLSARHPETSADLSGNLIDGRVRSRDGARLRLHDNIDVAVWQRYLGRDPVRGLFRDAAALDLTWAGDPPQRADAEDAPPIDLCGARRSTPPVHGAAEDPSACVTSGSAGR